MLAHPRNVFASRRLEQARRDLVRPAVPERKRRGAAPARGVLGQGHAPRRRVDRQGGRAVLGQRRRDHRQGRVPRVPRGRAGGGQAVLARRRSRRPLLRRRPSASTVLGEVAQAPVLRPRPSSPPRAAPPRTVTRWPWVTMIRVLQLRWRRRRAHARAARDRRARHAAAHAQAPRRRSGQGAARRAQGDLTISSTPAPTVTSVR